MLPHTCALNGVLVCCLQAGLPTFPTGGVPLLGTRGKRICWVQIGGQKRRVEVALDGTNATGALVPALAQRLGIDLSPCLKAGDSWAEHSGPGMLARRQNAVTG
jgi:hypothetical protein